MWDIAIDKPSGDWLFSPNLDWKGIRGDEVVRQRIWIRCKVERGWINDPTGGTLGSRLKLATRGQRERAKSEIPLYIEEALAPMPDVTILDINVVDITTTSVFAEITYRSHDLGDPRPLTQQENEVVTVELPV